MEKKCHGDRKKKKKKTCTFNALKSPAGKVGSKIDSFALSTLFHPGSFS